MKTTLFTCLLLCTVLSFTALAQTEKGTKLVGGTGTIRFNNPFSISLAPDLGIFLADNAALGATVQVSYSSQDNPRYSTTGLGLAPFFRYYFSGNETNKIFGQFNAGIFHTQNTYPSGFNTETSRSYNYTNVGLGLGLVHFFTKQVGLEGILAYNSNSYINSNNSSGSLTLNLGFQIYLPAKSK